MKQKVVFTLLFCLSLSLAGGDNAAAQRARKRAKKPPRTTTVTQPNEQDAVTTETTPPETTPTAEATETPPPQPAKKRGRKSARKSAAAVIADEVAAEEDEPKTEEQLKADLDALLLMPVEDRIPRLRFFLQDYPQTGQRARATEQLITALAASGDTKLQGGDAEGGVGRFREALKLVPAETTDKFFGEVISQFPANLFLRGQHEAALEAARHVEAQAKDNAPRLLLIGTFYLSAEQPDDALRVAEAASALAPELLAAHLARAQALRLALRLEEAAAAYARALELDPQSPAARRGLADLRRATGKPEAAAVLYREQLAADAADTSARTGLILSLFDAGQKEEAERELEASLKENPQQLILLSGAAYWYAAHSDPARALDLAEQAVRIEPRYTWAQIALGRALVAGKRPLDAERALRFARQYGRFPTLDYELAHALAAAGLYEEAAEELARSFVVRNGEIETRLAGRNQTRAASFIDLLAPERRASIFQHAAADDEENARRLKALLALHQRLNKVKEGGSSVASSAGAAPAIDETIEAARDFAAGDDEMRTFRRLYAANRLLRSGLDSGREVLALTEGAKSGVEAALDTTVATNALLADELRDARARAIAQGATPDVPEVPRYVLSNIARGRIEELIGWTLLNQNRVPEAVTALRRAVSVLPPNSLYWRNAHWRLGSALQTDGQEAEALAAYLKAYDRQQPDAPRRSILEALYRKVNGSLEGLEAKLDAGPARPADNPAAAIIASSAKTDAPPPKSVVPATSSAAAFITTPSPAAKDESPRVETEASDIPAPSTDAQTPALTPSPEAPPTIDPSPAPTLSATPDPTPDAATPALTPSPKPEARRPAASELPPGETPVPLPDFTPIAATPEPTATPTPDPAAAGLLPTAKPAPTPVVEPTPPELPEASSSATKQSPSPEQLASAASPSEGPPPPAHLPAARRRRRTQPSAGCALALDAETLSVNSNGGAGVVTARLGGAGGGDVNATTPNWADILILREPASGGESDIAFKFTITSISKSVGTFAVVFKSPCGTTELAVTVK